MSQCPECGGECHSHKEVMKVLERGIDLIHEVMKQCNIEEETRHQLAKWRDDANGLIP